jgi:SNF2 family DNA or RNA helicase
VDAHRSPATKSGQDYYVYLQTCEPGRHGSYLQFSERFCEKTINWFTRKWEYKGVKKDKRAELGAIFKRLGLRRKLEEVAPELPAKIFTDIPVAMPESVVKKFLELKKRYAVAIEAGTIPRDLPGELADLRLEIGLIKSEVAVEYVLNAGRPMIVFTQRIETADTISSSLMEQGIKVGKITGAESSTDKDRSVVRFQAGELDVIVANIAAGGVGLTLTRANTVLFAELTSSPAEEGQAIGRINRIGQNAKVLQIIKLIGEKSVDSSIEKSLLYKGEFMSEVMGD